MAQSALDGKSKPPQDDDLARILGSSHSHWKNLIDRITELFAPLTEEWISPTKTTGWALRLKKGKRAVLYMSPRQGHFLASFALGEKAVRVAKESDLPETVLQIIEKAPKYAEGRGVRIEVRSAKDVRAIEELAAIKMAN